MTPVTLSRLVHQPHELTATKRRAPNTFSVGDEFDYVLDSTSAVFHGTLRLTQVHPDIVAVDERFPQGLIFTPSQLAP